MVLYNPISISIDLLRQSLPYLLLEPGIKFTQYATAKMNDTYADTRDWDYNYFDGVQQVNQCDKIK